MKHIFAILAIAITASLLIMSVSCITSRTRECRVKILTYNIRNGVGMDDVRDYDRLTKVITRAGADVVAVQEVDSVTNRSGGKYVLGEIESRTSYHPYFSPAIEYDGGKYGIGLLSKEEPLNVRHRPLPGREEERTLIVAEFPSYVIANAHLSLTPEDAIASVSAIVEEAKAVTKPFIVAGDWNSEPDSPVLDALRGAGFVIVSDGTTPTWPADKPDKCLDYIAVYRPDEAGVVSLSTSVINEPTASDHRPIEVTLRINKSLGK